MTFLNHAKYKYLILIPLIFLILNAVYYRYMMAEINNKLLQEKFNQVAADVDILGQSITEFVNTDHDWGVYDYADKVSNLTTAIGALPHTVAEVYQQTGDGLIMLSQKTTDTEERSFDPRRYQQFNAAVAKQEQGQMVLDFTAGRQKPQPMYLYFRWIPTGPKFENRFLVVVAVSRQSVTTPMALWVSIGQWASMAITFLLETWLVLLVSSLGRVYDSYKILPPGRRFFNAIR